MRFRGVWEGERVKSAYVHGVDWEYVRTYLNAKSTSPMAKHAVQLVTSRAFWSDERRWLSGYLAQPHCTVCNEAVGDDKHLFAGECEGVQAALLWEKVAGR